MSGVLLAVQEHLNHAHLTLTDAFEDEQRRPSLDERRLLAQIDAAIDYTQKMREAISHEME